MSKKVTIRLERELIDTVREKHPEFKEVSDVDVARIVFRKFLEGKHDV